MALVLLLGVIIGGGISSGVVCGGVVVRIGCVSSMVVLVVAIVRAMEMEMVEVENELRRTRLS